MLDILKLDDLRLQPLEFTHPAIPSHCHANQDIEQEHDCVVPDVCREQWQRRINALVPGLDETNGDRWRRSGWVQGQGKTNRLNRSGRGGGASINNSDYTWLCKYMDIVLESERWVNRWINRKRKIKVQITSRKNSSSWKRRVFGGIYRERRKNEDKLHQWREAS